MRDTTVGFRLLLTGASIRVTLGLPNLYIRRGDMSSFDICSKNKTGHLGISTISNALSRSSSD